MGTRCTRFGDAYTACPYTEDMAGEGAAAESSAHATPPGRLAGPPVATWSAFRDAVEALRRAPLPSTVDVEAIPLVSKSSASQVRQTLRVLGLIDDRGTPTLEFRRLHGGQDSVVVAALRAHYPALASAIEANAPVSEVARLFNEIQCGDATRTRFRSFMLSAFESVGVPTDAYRRLRSAQARPRRNVTAALASAAPEADPGTLDDASEPVRSGEAQPSAFRRQQAHALLAAQVRAFDRSEPEVAHAIGREIDHVCESLATGQPAEPT